MLSMNLEQLRAAVSAGGVAGITLRARGDGFFVEIATISGQDAMLARVRGPQPRCFVNPRSGLGMLRTAGVMNVTVDLTYWKPPLKPDKPEPPSKPLKHHRHLEN